MPESFLINDNLIVPPVPAEDMDEVEILRGPNIKPFPATVPLAESIEAKVLLKVGDNITTDHIMPAGAKILPLRSNIPAISSIALSGATRNFPPAARRRGPALSSAGSTTARELPGTRGAGASLPRDQGRDRQILCPHPCGQPHQRGDPPLTFANEADYDRISFGDELCLPDIRRRLDKGNR